MVKHSAQKATNQSQFGVDIWKQFSTAQRGRDVHVQGTVPTIDGLIRRISELLDRQSVDRVRVRAVLIKASRASWRRIVAEVKLYRGIGGSSRDGELTTVVLPGDERAQVLARKSAWALLRLSDGTVGWAREPQLGRVALRHQTMPCWDSARLDRVASAYLGTSYLRGGTTRHGVDCSGLVQRVFRSIGVTIPRHSQDQLLWGAERRGAERPGDVAYFSSASERGLHAGLLVKRDSGLRLIHASVSRQQVVSDDWSRLKNQEGAVSIVRGSSFYLRYLRTTLNGQPSIDLPDYASAESERL